MVTLAATNLVYDVLVTIVVLGVLIFVHELGHFMAAKSVGIAVPRFSIGFGPPTPIRFRRGETEYLISWVPFGGYVKMASLEEQQAMESLEGGSLEQEFPPEQLFESKSLPARILVLAAGVIMNALFAWGVYSGLLMVRGQAIDPNTEISRVDDTDLPEAAQALAGVPFGAKVERVNDQPVDSWNQIIDGVLDPRTEQLRFDFASAESITVDVPGVDAEGRAKIAQAIIPLREPRVGLLNKTMPAAIAGLQPGDLITSAGGTPLPSWDALVSAVEASVGQPILLSVERDGAQIEIEVTPAETEISDLLTGETRKVGRIGIAPQVDTRLVELGIGASLVEGARQTWDNGVQVLVFLKGMILGRVSAKQLGGPIMIGQASGRFARAGLVPLLTFMAFLSVNLAVLNLLPIPVLDGGHLVFLVLEGLMGKPLPQALRMQLTQIGLFLLLGLMLFAVVNDIFRIVG